MEPTQVEQMILLLHAQQREARIRSDAVRFSVLWRESSARLDVLNDQIMHLGAITPARVRRPVRPPVRAKD